MSKIFAIFIPIFTIIITTFFIIFSMNNSNKNANKERNKKAYLILLTLGAVALLFIGIRIGFDKTTHIDTDIFRYKGAYIGNNSAVGNIAYYLPTSKEFKQLSLQTNEEPYGMTLYYEQAPNVSRDEDKKNVITLATYMFTLISNAEWITVNYPYGEYTLTREQVQQWYGTDLSKITNEKDLKKLIENHLKDDTEANKLFP